ncbi:MAG: 5-formyltetrahydrofolate cyclo-ligase [Mycobacterium sp.]
MTTGGEPAYIQTMEGLRELVLACPWNDDGLMPPEPRLMEMFGVSRGTLRRATDQLVREGLLVPERGRGTFVNRRAQVRATVRDALLAIATPDSHWHLDVDRFVPSFDGAAECTDKLAQLPAYQAATQLFITPDNSTELLRRRALEDGKRVVISTFGQRRGMVLLDPTVIEPHRYELAATLDGLERCGQSLGLTELRALGRFDLLVTGAFAVTRQGVHVDADADYFDLEWGLLAELGLVVADTPVVALVHDAQIIDVPLRLEPHEIAIDVVLSPRDTLRTGQTFRRPLGLTWQDLSDDVVSYSPYLRALAAENTGDTTVGPHPAALTWAGLKRGDSDV